MVAVMRTIGDRADVRRLRALIVLLWRAGLRISEAPALQEATWTALAAPCSSGAGRGGRRREVGMDRLGWEHYADSLVMPT
jgi:site-specific recombinase XerC